MTWPCEAYGADGLEVGALCFRAADIGARVCGDQGECGAVMAAERRRLFGRINELAAAGDPTGELLAAEFATPDELLGGSGDVT